MDKFVQYRQMVVDIETLSPDKIRDGGVVITEIAARPFNIIDCNIELGDMFSIILDVPSQIAAGFRVDPDTLNWHARNGRNIEDLLNQKGVDLDEGICAFLAWSRKNLHKDVKVYAWGSDFDIPIIHKSYVAYTGETNTSDSLFPWRFGNYRCARTLFNELTEETGVPSKKPHVAAKDVDIEIFDIVQAWNFRRERKLILNF